MTSLAVTPATEAVFQSVTDLPGQADRHTTGTTTCATAELTGESIAAPWPATRNPTANTKSNDRRADRRINSPAAWEEGKTHCAG